VTTAPKPWCCPRWTSPNGACSDDDSGAGLHTCRVTSPTHAKCRCACGVETLRPVGDRLVGASVSVDEKGRGRVVAGLTDITNHVSGGVVEFKAMHETRITVELPVASLFARGEVELDEETAKALEALGWSGPDTELLRRRDLQEALGGLGAVLREWDDLLDVVRQLGQFIYGPRDGTSPVLTKVVTALGRYAPNEVKWSRVLESIGELAGRMEGLEK
jgi:hypothetical protein